MQLPNYSSARVLVVGDLMLDRYWHGITSRISPEAPVPIVHVQEDEQRAGGAANVALNIVALGAKVSLIGFVGDDERAITLTTILKNAGVNCLFEKLNNYPTITKLRVISRHQQLLRMDFEDGFHQADNQTLLTYYQAELEQAQVVVLSDYGKGTLHTIGTFITLARKMNKPVLIDPKGTDFNRYQGATLITPNLSEFEAIVGVCADQAQIVTKGMSLLTKLQLDSLLITRSEQGMTLLTQNEPSLHLSTHALEVFDVTGAGDTVISTLAVSLAAKSHVVDAVKLANLAAGIVVGKLGAATVNIEEFKAVLHEHQPHSQGVGTLNQIRDAITEAHAKGEKVVLTNGCFDLLHLGHITYLTQAKALGERLLVLVNSDESVKRLKGSARPINQLSQRMEMLAALASVDWVMAFTEDTPEQIIAQLLPDILVKGGDYTDITAIAGAEAVIENGGEVKLLTFVEGLSTSHLIESIQGEGND
jgi:D-beta-D-heptose 7-phosphate kinase/D-beta-D-heptose 1-phosphate adenosyltransferase